MPAPEVTLFALPSASVTTTTCADPDPLALAAMRDPSGDQTGGGTTIGFDAGSLVGAVKSAFATHNCQPPDESVPRAQYASRLPLCEYVGE